MTILRRASPKVMLMAAEHEKCLRGYDERHGADTIQRTPTRYSAHRYRYRDSAREYRKTHAAKNDVR